MKTGLVSVTFRQLTPEAIIDLAAECGLQGIEWGGDIHLPPGDRKRAAEIRSRMADRGLASACYGSYYRLTDDEAGQADKVVETAAALGAPMIRVWAGDRGSVNADAAQRAMVCRNLQYLSDLAADAGLQIVTEWHGGTLTDETGSALQLLRSVGRANAGTLWQPPVGMAAAECAGQIRRAAEFIRNIHVFSWQGTDRLPLSAGAEKWRVCLPEIEKLPGERYLLLEFVRGNAPEQLRADAGCLHRWLRGEWENDRKGESE